MNDFNLLILNDGSATRLSFGYKTFSSIDITLITSSLATHFECQISDNLYGSDHFPMIIPILTSNRRRTRRPRWILRRDDWELFRSTLEFDNDTSFADIDSYSNYITSNTIQAAKISIPKSSVE